jgi:hypothetical protein
MASYASTTETLGRVSMELQRVKSDLDEALALLSRFVLTGPDVKPLDALDLAEALLRRNGRLPDGA